jgi:hypothetical protein
VNDTTIHILITRDNGDGSPLEPLITGFMRLKAMTPKGDGTVDIEIQAGARFHETDEPSQREILRLVRDFADEYIANPGNGDTGNTAEVPIPKSKLN